MAISPSLGNIYEFCNFLHVIYVFANARTNFR